MQWKHLTSQERLLLTHNCYFTPSSCCCLTHPVGVVLPVCLLAEVLPATKHLLVRRQQQLVGTCRDMHRKHTTVRGGGGEQSATHLCTQNVPGPKQRAKTPRSQVRMLQLVVESPPPTTSPQSWTSLLTPMPPPSTQTFLLQVLPHSLSLRPAGRPRTHPAPSHPPPHAKARQPLNSHTHPKAIQPPPKNTHRC